jgi:hypothetical protein
MFFNAEVSLVRAGVWSNFPKQEKVVCRNYEEAVKAFTIKLL